MMAATSSFWRAIRFCPSVSRQILTRGVFAQGASSHYCAERTFGGVVLAATAIAPAKRRRLNTSRPAIAMEHSYDDDNFVKTFPQHQQKSQPLGARYATLLEPGDNSKKHFILVTITCIVLVHFQDTITSWIRHCRERGVIDVLWDLWNVVSVHTQAILETAKIFVFSLYSTELDIPSLAIIRRRRALAAISSMPELEDMEYSDHAEEKKESKTKETNGAENGRAKWRRLNEDELEPAFLREEDYPPDWMVYDRELGVILKTEADKRRSKQPCYIKATQTTVPRSDKEQIPAVTAR